MKYGAGSDFARSVLARTSSVCMVERMESALTAAEPALLGSEFAAPAAGSIANCTARSSDAAGRSPARFHDGPFVVSLTECLRFMSFPTPLTELADVNGLISYYA